MSLEERGVKVENVSQSGKLPEINADLPSEVFRSYCPPEKQPELELELRLMAARALLSDPEGLISSHDLAGDVCMPWNYNQDTGVYSSVVADFYRSVYTSKINIRTDNQAETIFSFVYEPNLLQALNLTNTIISESSASPRAITIALGALAKFLEINVKSSESEVRFRENDAVNVAKCLENTIAMFKIVSTASGSLPVDYANMLQAIVGIQRSLSANAVTDYVRLNRSLKLFSRDICQLIGNYDLDVMSNTLRKIVGMDEYSIEDFAPQFVHMLPWQQLYVYLRAKRKSVVSRYSPSVIVFEQRLTEYLMAKYNEQVTTHTEVSFSGKLAQMSLPELKALVDTMNQEQFTQA